MKVKVCTDAKFCIQITDQYTGIVSTGTGESYQEALGAATRDIYEELLQDGQLSVYDLCELHMSFPHPDQDNCSDVKINPCDLLHPVDTTPSTIRKQKRSMRLNSQLVYFDRAMR
jgi:hypothetical protein